MVTYNDPDDVRERYPWIDDPRDRQPGLLTYDDREFLIGEKDHPESTYKQARQRLRDRVRNGFADFAYLELLDDRDRELIFSDVGSTLGAVDGEEGDEDVTIGLYKLIAFLFDGCDRYAPQDLEEVIERGIDEHVKSREKAVGPHGEIVSVRPTANVSIDVEWGEVVDSEAALERLRDGERLRSHEVAEILSWEQLTEEDWELLREQYSSDR